VNWQSTLKGLLKAMSMALFLLPPGEGGA